MRLTYESSWPFCYRIQSFVKAVLLLPRCFRLKRVHWSGIAKESGQWAQAVYVGEGESLQYLQRRLFDKVVAEQQTVLPLWRLGKELDVAAAGPALVVVEMNRLLHWVLPQGGRITYPWIRQRVDLESVRYQHSRIRVHTTYGRLVRKYQYRARTTKNRAEVRRFYYAFYEGYIRHRHEQQLHARKEDELTRAGIKGCLMQIYRGEEWISGVICRMSKNTITALAFGLAPPYEQHLKRGAMSAAYYFLFRLAEENNLRFVDLLRSRADLKDGVYEHKRRWGAEAFADPWCHTLICVYSRSHGAVNLTAEMLFFTEGVR